MAPHQDDILDDIIDSAVEMLSHEMGTPLTILRLSLEAIKTHPGDLPPEVLKQIGISEQQFGRIQHLLASIRQYWDIRRQPEQIDKTYKIIDLVEFIIDVVKSHKPWAESQEIRFNYQTRTDSLFAYASPAYLTIVFNELIGNALKFTGQRGIVSVNIDRTPQSGCVTITNTGALLDTQRAFVPFYKAGRNEPGVGIGLTIARFIIRHHNGRITAHSQDNVTTFAVTLPLANDDDTE